MNSENPEAFLIVLGVIMLSFVLVKIYQRFPSTIDEDMESLDLGSINYEKKPNEPVGLRGYACPGCGAALADAADVSPSGDVKCKFCQRWFNIHRN